MKINPIFRYSLLFLLVLTILTIISFSDDTFFVFHRELRKPSIKELLTWTPPPPPQIAIKKTNSIVAAVPVQPLKVIDTTPQRILMVGESMIQGLLGPFMKYARYNHDKVLYNIWYGSTLIAWAQNDTLKKVIEKAKPTFIILSIASNELTAKYIKVRDPYVKKILKQLEGYNYVWIGPPNPSVDYGINDLIEGNTGEDRFFMSKYMRFDRMKDGTHPTMEASKKWADSIATWIMDKSRYPIMLKRPEAGMEQTLKEKSNIVDKQNKEGIKRAGGL